MADATAVIAIGENGVRQHCPRFENGVEFNAAVGAFSAASSHRPNRPTEMRNARRHG
ncbi:hypothetical protein [Embleya sp. NPDC020886]|uniref:hypothetical protein n=1 Tax=Embleya sp. NPDC020886 TaxID=3363980 RepID=UPI0037BDC31B